MMAKTYLNVMNVIENSLRREIFSYIKELTPGKNLILVDTA
jgi:hypothetical protein